jgi:hypothetical protein
MNRSPLYYPMNRGGDADAGGAADLQTDVMRFMAILSLCLMAIFALVQSIPLAPTTPAPDKPASNSPPQTLVEETPEEAVQETEIVLTRPAPTRMAARSKSVELQRPSPMPVDTAEPEETTVPTKNSAPAAAAVVEAALAEEGFTLRFETDVALTALVARQLVGFYAITPEKSLRMSISGDAISFWPASLPGRYHEMDEATVPADVRAAYRNTNRADDIKWGVTLPTSMSRELNAILSNESGGSLVIAASGQIDLRH